MAEQDTRAPHQAPRGESHHREGAQHGADRAAETLAQELKHVIAEAALEVLGPAARQATRAAAQYAVSKGPEVVAKRVMPAVSNAGGPNGVAQWARSMGSDALADMGGIAGIAGKLMSKRKGGGGDPTGWGRGRRMPVQQFVYVSVPVKDAYNGWTEYKRWPRYMHRANQVDTQFTDQEARVKVTEKMWGFARPFTAEVVAQRPDEHIRWNSTEGVKHTGVINFHELGPRLTLIEVNLDHSPSGPLEKYARGARYVKRAVRADFHRFQAWIEMKSPDELAELEGWRGTIEDRRIVISHEDALEAEQREEEGDQQYPEGEYEEEPVAVEEEEPEAVEEEEPEAVEEEEPEAVEEEELSGEEEAAAPRPRQPRPRTRQQATRAKEVPQSAATRRRPRSADEFPGQRGRRA